MFVWVLSWHGVQCHIDFNFHNQTHRTIHVCTTDFREFSSQILFESVLEDTTRHVLKQFTMHNWQYTSNITSMPQRMKDIYELKGYTPANCVAVSFDARIVVPGVLKHIVPHAQVKIDVDACVRGAHAYHSVYISNCPVFGTIVFSHDITPFQSSQWKGSRQRALVITDVYVQVPWTISAAGQTIVNDIATQTTVDVNALVDFMCFNMSNRHTL